MSGITEQSKMTFAVALAWIAGAMMIAGGITSLLLASWTQSMFGGGYMMGGGMGMFMSSAHIQNMIHTFSAISVAIGTVIMASGYIIRSKPQTARSNGVVILVLSIIGIFFASGFGMGAILGMIAGIMAIARK